MARSTVLSIFKRSSNNAVCRTRETDVRAAKPILSPFAKNKNLIELEVFFPEIVHPDLYSGKVWGFSIFFILHTSMRNFGMVALLKYPKDHQVKPVYHVLEKH